MCCLQIRRKTKEKEDKQARLTVVLAEFTALRGEIKDRSSTAWTLLNINITATATVVGFVLSEKAQLNTLLILPLISPALGMLFVDHAFNITNLGRYINNKLRPLVCEIAKDDRLLAYEKFVSQYEKNIMLRFLPLIFPLSLLFAGVPCAALWFIYPEVVEDWEWYLWRAGVIMVVAFLYLWLTFFLTPYGEKKND